MTPEAQAYLSNARQELDDAKAILGINLHHIAARSAYYAIFHAAEAMIFETSGRVAKTHSGVRSTFSNIAKDNVKLGTDLGKILAKGYEYKEISDYGTNPRSAISRVDAEEAIAGAELFVQRVEAALT